MERFDVAGFCVLRLTEVAKTSQWFYGQVPETYIWINCACDCSFEHVYLFLGKLLMFKIFSFFLSFLPFLSHHYVH